MCGAHGAWPLYAMFYNSFNTQPLSRWQMLATWSRLSMSRTLHSNVSRCEAFQTKSATHASVTHEVLRVLRVLADGFQARVAGTWSGSYTKRSETSQATCCSGCNSPDSEHTQGLRYCLSVLDGLRTRLKDSPEVGIRRSCNGTGAREHS